METFTTCGANICISLCVLAFQFLQLQRWAGARQSRGPDASSKDAPAGLSLGIPRRLPRASCSPLAPRELLRHPTSQDGGSHPSHQHHKPAAQAGQRPAADTDQTRRPQQGQGEEREGQEFAPHRQFGLVLVRLWPPNYVPWKWICQFLFHLRFFVASVDTKQMLPIKLSSRDSDGGHKARRPVSPYQPQHSHSGKTNNRTRHCRPSLDEPYPAV